MKGKLKISKHRGIYLDLPEWGGQSVYAAFLECRRTEARP